MEVPKFDPEQQPDAPEWKSRPGEPVLAVDHGTGPDGKPVVVVGVLANGIQFQVVLRPAVAEWLVDTVREKIALAKSGLVIPQGNGKPPHALP